MRKVIFTLLGLLILSVTSAQTIEVSGSTTFCNGGNVVLTVKDIPNNASLQWTKNDVPITPSETSQTYTATSSGKYNVLVNSFPTGSPVEVTVNPNPAVDFSFTPTAGCGRTKINFANSSNDGGTPASTNGLQYKWDFGDGSSSNSDAPSHTFNPGKGTGNTSFNVTLTVTNSSGCSSSLTKTVTIGKSPDATLNGPGFTDINGDPYFKICSATGQTFSFTNGSTTTLTNTQYIIRWGDATPDSVFNSFSSVIKHPYSVGIKKLTFIVYSGSCVDSTVYNIFVGNIPAGGIVGIGGSTICAGDAQQFVITGTENNPPGTLYVLQYKDGTKTDTFYHPAPDTITHMFLNTSCGTNSSNGSQTFTNSFGAYLTITNPCGLAGGSILPIYVSNKPKADFSISKTSLCEGQTVSFTNTGSTGSNVQNGNCTQGKSIWRIQPYNPGDWAVVSGYSLGNDYGDPDPNLWTAGSNPLNVIFYKKGVYTITLVMANNTLCGADSIVKTICVNPAPTASFSLDKNTGCAPFNVVATNNSSIPTCGNNSYQWTVTYSNSSGCTPNSSGYNLINGTSLTSPNPEFNFTNPGVYTITLITKAPGGACTTTSGSQTITVKTKPVVTLNVPSSVCQNGSINPTATVYNCYSSTAASYLWSFDGGNPGSSNSANPGSISYPNTGLYTVKLDVTNECGTTPSSQNISVNTLPTLTVPSDQTFCAGQPTGGFNFTSGTGGTITWTRTSGNIGASLPLSGSGSISSFTATNTTGSPISSTFTVTATSSNNCKVVQTFTVTVNPTPVAPTVSGISNCQNAIATPLTANGTSLNWYSGLTGGVPNANAPTPNTATPGVFYFYVSQTNSYSCESPRATIAVTINATPNISATGVNPTSCSSATGKITISGVTSGVTYTISYTKNGSSPVTLSQTASLGTLTISGLTAGIYDNIKVTISGCTSNVEGPITLVDPTPPTAPVAGSNGPICSGNTLLLTASTIAGATYQWTGPNFSSTAQNPSIPNASPAASGTYSVIVKVANCSSQAGTADVAVNPTPTISFIGSNTPLCEGSTLNLSSTVSASGTATYAWTGPNGYTSTQPNNSVSNITTADGGVYTLKVTDGSCSASKSTSVVINTIPSITVTPINPTSCGSATGKITISGLTTSGTYVIKYTKNGIVTTQNLTPNAGSVVIGGLTSGTYSSISATLSSTGCTSNIEGPFTLSDPTPPSTPIATSSSPVCSGSTLNLYANAITGATYQWTGPNGFTNSSQNPTINAALISASGTYQVTATTSGCTSAAGSVDVLINPTPSISTLTPITICEGSDINLTANVNAPAGTTYSWTGPNGFSYNQLTASITGATTQASGAYTLTATSGTCSDFKSTTVTVNTVPSITASSTDPTVCGSSTGSITISGSLSGSYDVKYLKNGAAVVKTLIASAGAVTINGLTAGTYSNITVTPSNTTCASNAVGPFDLHDPNPPSQPIISSNNSPICAGNTLILVAGGAPTGATYSWTTPTGTIVSGSTYTLPNAPSSASGTYSVKAILSGCNSIATSVPVTINTIPVQPSASSNSPVCEGTTLYLYSSSTTPNVSYTWTGPNGFNSTYPNPSITIVPTAASGIYSVTATSTEGCSSQARSISVTVNAIPMANVTMTQPSSCTIANGVMTISGLTSSGTYTVQYTKDGVAVPAVTKTPNNGTITIPGLSTGTYSNITVSINGCSSVPAGPYTLNNPSPPSAPIVASNNSPLCAGGTLTLTASGAPSGGTYSWTTPSGTVVSGATLSIPNVATTASGIYNVKSILNGCTSLSATVDVTINPVPVQPLITNNSPVCDGNSINLSASSSTGSTYSWTGPNGFTSSTQDVSISNASFAEAGNYTVVATLGSCTSSKSTTVVVNLVPKITSYNSTDPANCSTSNGTIILRGLAPNTTYSIQYTKNGAAPTVLLLTSNSTGVVTIQNLSAGLYENVTVALNGCPSPPVGPFDLIQPDAPSTPVAQSNSPVCVGSTINLLATTTSTGNVSYQWTGPNGFTSNLQNLSIPNATAQASGIYYVTVKVNGCSSSAGFTKVVVNPIPSAPVVYPIYYCINATPVALTANPDLGNTLNWYTSLSGGTSLGQAPVPNTNSVGTTNYYVSQSSPVGCEGPRTAIPVIVNSYPVITATSYTDPPRCSTTNGTISLSGLTPNTDYIVNYNKDGKPVTGSFTSNTNGVILISPLTAGIYSQISVSYHDCSSNVVGPFTLVESSVPPSVPKASVNSKICVGDDITLNAQSSTQGVSYQWTGPNGFVSNLQNPVISNSTANASGKYYVLTQLNDCISEKDSVIVQVNEVPSVPTILSPANYCQGDKAQILQANVSQGNTILWYSIPQNGSGSMTPPLPSTSTAGTLIFYASQITPQGCESSKGSTTITIYAKPSATIQVSGSQCEKDNLTFTSNVQSPDALSTLIWKLSNGISSTGSSFIYQFNQPGSYSAQLVASTVHGCNDTVIKTVQILPAPILTTSQDLNLCLGNSAQLSVSGASTYQWTPVNGLSCVSCANPVAAPITTTNYVVQGTDVNGCRSFDTVVVNVVQPFNLTVSAGDSICIGSSVTLLASGAPAYTWTPSQGLNSTNVANPVATPAVTTDYIVVGYDQFKCFTDTSHVLIAVGKSPTVSLGPDTLVSTGTLFPLKTAITGGPVKTWTWSPTTNLSCTNCALPIATIKRDIAYSVRVTNAYGCTASDTILIKVTCDPSQVFIPNAFTPDGDGVNDILMVRSKGMSTVKFFRIFNRWGELVFEKENFQPNDPAFGWDGKIRGKAGPPDVFVYTAEVICDNGGVFTYKGNVSIIK